MAASGPEGTVFSLRVPGWRYQSERDRDGGISQRETGMEVSVRERPGWMYGQMMDGWMDGWVDV